MGQITVFGITWGDFVSFCVGATAVLVLILTLRKVVGPAWQEFKEFLLWWRKFQRSWDGEDGGDDRDAVPGVMARLNAIDGEFRRNGGQSMKDLVSETKRSVDRIEENQAVLTESQRKTESAIRDSEKQRTKTMVAANKNLDRIREAFLRAKIEPPDFDPLE